MPEGPMKNLMRLLLDNSIGLRKDPRGGWELAARGFIAVSGVILLACLFLVRH